MYCVHEVSHAVACLNREIPFRGIRIFKQGEEPDVLLDGQTVCASGGRVETVGEWTLSESAEDMIVMLLAGPASTRKLTHKSWFLVNVIGSGCSDYEEAVRIVALRFGETVAKKCMEKCERVASRLVAKEWQTILRIAGVLFERSSLSYAEFLQLYVASTTPAIAPTEVSAKERTK
jgi:hypothetical protein